MRRINDLTGQKFTRWTVASRAENKGVKTAWNCVCDCGCKKVVTTSDLTTQNSRSCGCLAKEVSRRSKNRKHGLEGTITYSLWANIRHRTTNPKHRNYKNYGGRGISMYKAWVDDVEAFSTYIQEVLGDRPEGSSIDRIDCNGGYAPGNIRWATAEQQQRNTRQNMWVMFEGKEVLQVELAKLLGVSASTINYRVKKGVYQARKGLIVD